MEFTEAESNMNDLISGRLYFQMITLEQGIMSRKEACYIELILDLPTVLNCSSQAEAG